MDTILTASPVCTNRVEQLPPTAYCLTDKHVTIGHVLLAPI